MLRIATLGTSVITRQFIEAAQSLDDVRVVACCSRTTQRAAEFAASVGVERGLAGLEAALAADDIDAIYVASPNAAHGEPVAAALEAGKHVLCEKPLVPTAAEAETLFALAEEKGVVLLEGMRSAYDPGMATVRELLPRLGRIRRASLRYIQRSARYDKVLAGEQVTIFDPRLAGGALRDLGVYCVHPLVDLFGEPSDLLAASVPIATGADGAGAVIAVYPGMVADLSYSKITRSELPSEIQGELATLTIDHIAAPRHLILDGIDGSREEFRPDGAANNLVYEVRHFARLVAATGGAGGPRGEAAGEYARDTERSLIAARLVDRIAAGTAQR